MTDPLDTDEPRPHRRAIDDGLTRKTHIDVLLKALRTDDHWTVRMGFALIAVVANSVSVRLGLAAVASGGSVLWVGRHLLG